MSYLDLPRLYFAGRFFTNPSTINNKLANFHPDVKLIPRTGSSPSTVLEEFAGFQYINPYGLANFSLVDCVVSGAQGMDGRGWGGQPLGTVTSGAPYAKMTDLDADQQSISQLFGLVIRVDMADGSGFQGPVEATGLQDLWYGRVPSASFDQKAAGWFQSLILADNLTWWGCEEKTALAYPLKSRCVTGVSIKLMMDGYHGDTGSPDFNYGRMIGILGPGLAGEPMRFPAERRLSTCGQAGKPTFGPGFWKLDAEALRVTLDICNSAPLQDTAGESIDFGVVRAVIAGETPEPLGTCPLDYGRGALVRSGGLVDISVTAGQATKLETLPLGLVAERPGAPPQYLLKEDAGLTWVNCEPSCLRLEVGERGTAMFYARKAGKPLANETLDLSITRHLVNNRPKSGVEFPSSLVTDEHGQASATVVAHSPRPLPPRRGVVDSQVYYLGGSWQKAGDLTRQSGGGVLSVLVFAETPEVENPTWIDHAEPIFSFYARLYPGMAVLLGIADYPSVRANAAHLRWRITLPREHPLHFPSSRDLSGTKARMLCRWFDRGMVYE